MVSGCRKSAWSAAQRRSCAARCAARWSAIFTRSARTDATLRSSTAVGVTSASVRRRITADDSGSHQRPYVYTVMNWTGLLPIVLALFASAQTAEDLLDAEIVFN